MVPREFNPERLLSDMATQDPEVSCCKIHVRVEISAPKIVLEATVQLHCIKAKQPVFTGPKDQKVWD